MIQRYVINQSILQSFLTVYHRHLHTYMIKLHKLSTMLSKRMSTWSVGLSNIFMRNTRHDSKCSPLSCSTCVSRWILTFVPSKISYSKRVCTLSQHEFTGPSCRHLRNKKMLLHERKIILLYKSNFN